MKIIYSVNEDDVVDFIGHYSAMNIPSTVQLRERNVRNIYIIVLMIVIIIVLTIESSLYKLIGIFVLIPLIVLYPYSGRSRRVLKKQLRKKVKEGEYRELLGRQEMEITDTGITQKRSDGMKSTNWKDIKNIYATSSRAFIYASDVGYIIPKSSVIEGDWATFISELQKKKGSP